MPLMVVILIVLTILLVRMHRQMAALRCRVDRLETLEQPVRTAAASAIEAPPPAARYGPEWAAEPVGQARSENPAAVPPPFIPPAPDRPVAPAAPVFAEEPARRRPAAPELAKAAPARPATPRPAPAKAPRPRINFEELFGRRLPIWAGGVTLAVAGVLIVKYSIDAGLLSPLVRVIGGLLFGAGLIAGAETARRFEDKVRDPRVAQALSGAGIASLYATILIAANLYHLIGPVTAFAGLAATTALALGLSIRFGAPSALLGLIGGLAAPALVGSSEPNVPLLATYLALAIGGLCTLSRSQRWLWLGVGALIGGFGWGAVLLVGSTLDAATSVSLGLFLVLLGIGLPLLIATGKLQTLIRAAAPLVAAVQLAALVAIGGFGMVQWSLFALIALAIIWLSRRDERLARLPVIGVVISLLLLGAWPMPGAGDFAIVALALALIHAIPAMVRLWNARGSIVEAGQIAAIALAGIAVTLYQFRLGDGSMDVRLAVIALAAALLPALGAALGWRSSTRQADARFATLATAAALLVPVAAALALPATSIAPATAIAAAALLMIGRAAKDRRLGHVSWVFGLAALPLLALGVDALQQFTRLGGAALVSPLPAVLRWGSLAAIATLFAWRSPLPVVRMLAQGLAALLGYATIAQIVPPTPLPLVPAIGMAAFAMIMARLPQARLLPAIVALFATSLLWAALPLSNWFSAAQESMIGMPMLIDGLPTLRDALLQLLAPAAAIGTAFMLIGNRLPKQVGGIAIGATLALGGVAGHIVFKQLLAIDTYDAFTQRGLIERTAWEYLLVAIGIGVRRWRRPVGLGIIAAGLAHFAWYTALFHNPLWWGQLVGSLPVFSWLLPAYALPLVMLWLAGRHEPALATRFARPRAIAQMLLILLLAVSVLRQLLVGTLLTVPGVSEAEDIGRSVLAIIMAIGFLLWGIRIKSRMWRVASLVLMIIAVIKVFLFDASGLDGLARIGSFVALGFALIGIGWLYSRQLSSAATPNRAG